MCASRHGKLPDRQPLAETLAFLAAPETWDANGPDGPFKDLKLQRLQFAVALAEAQAAGVLKDVRSLEQGRGAGGRVAIARRLLGHRRARHHRLAGRRMAACWPRRMACRHCSVARPTNIAEQVDKAQRWLETQRAQERARRGRDHHRPDWPTHSEAARHAPRAMLETDRAGPLDRRRLGTVREFAARRVRHGDRGVRPVGARRQFIRASDSSAVASFCSPQQEADGGWPATTRPPGVDSYAQRMSTTGWALQALLASRGTRTERQGD